MEKSPGAAAGWWGDDERPGLPGAITASGDQMGRKRIMKYATTMQISVIYQTMLTVFIPLPAQRRRAFTGEDFNHPGRDFQPRGR
jgi:hypothetical protein